MNFYSENMKKIKEIAIQTEKHNSRGMMDAVSDYTQQISLNVGLAINPLSKATLPFVIYVLEHYARELKKGKEKELEEVLKSIENLAGSIDIKIPGGFGGAGRK